MPVTPNISRDTFPTNKPKNYSRVTIQQGKPGVDAEINEALEGQNFERRQLSDDILVDGAISTGFQVVGTGASNAVNIMATGSAQDGTTVGRIRLNNWRLDLPVDFTSTDAGHYSLTGPNYYTLTGFTTPPLLPRTDLVYIEAYEEDIDSAIDPYLIDPVLTVECAIRKRVKYILQIAEGTTTLPSFGAGHYGIRLATISRTAGVATINALDVTDVRPTCTFPDIINPEVATARGSTASLNTRLSVSLQADGNLVTTIVDNSTLQDVANVLSIKNLGVIRTKIANEAVGTNQLEKTTDASKIQTINLADQAVTNVKIANNTVGTGQIENSVDANKVQRANIGNGVVGTGQIESTTPANKIQRVNIGPNVVGTNQIENSLDADKIQRVNVANQAIGTNQIEQTLNASKVQTANIADGAITDTQISATANISITKIDTSDIVSAGDIKWRIGATCPGRWLLMNGFTISKTGAGGVARANDDTQTLFEYLWNTDTTNTYAVVSAGRGVSANADFTAGKTITIPTMEGLVAVGYQASDGDFNLPLKSGGSKNHTHTVNAHTHTMKGHTHSGTTSRDAYRQFSSPYSTDMSTAAPPTDYQHKHDFTSGGPSDNTSDGASSNTMTSQSINPVPYRVGYYFIRY